MGPPSPSLNDVTATLYTIARIMDVGVQFLGEPGHRTRRRDGYERYRFDLYGPRKPDYLPIIGWAFTFTFIGLILVVAFLLMGP